MRYFPRRRSRPGASPGTLTNHEESAYATSAQKHLIQYNPDDMTSRDIADAETAPPAREGYVTWLHVQGFPSAELMEQLGRVYNLHPLALEDVVDSGERTKFDLYDEHAFIVSNCLVWRDGKLGAEQVSLFLGEDFVISIHDGPQDIYEPVRTRLKKKKQLRSSGADFLAYAILDLIVDRDFPLLEEMVDRLEKIEDEILADPAKSTMDKIHRARRDLSFMRRMLWPQREIINSLARDEDDPLSETTRLYLRDVYDHTVQILELIESYRESASSLLELYMSTINHRMNEVMKVLTMIATIFLPLSFIAGLYGMNFNTASPWNMPELGWHFGYFYVLGIMLVIAIGMIIVFKRKRWF